MIYTKVEGRLATRHAYEFSMARLAEPATRCRVVVIVEHRPAPDEPYLDVRVEQECGRDAMGKARWMEQSPETYTWQRAVAIAAILLAQQLAKQDEKAGHNVVIQEITDDSNPTPHTVATTAEATSAVNTSQIMASEHVLGDGKP